MSNEIDIVITKTDKSKLDEVRADAKKAGDQVSSSLKAGFKDGEQASERMRQQVGKDLDQTAKGAKETGGKAGKGFGEKFGESVETSLSGGAEGILGGLLDKMKGGGGLLAAGAGIGMGLLEGLTSSMENKKLSGLLAVQVGATSAEAGHLGRVAGQAFGENFGSTMEDVTAGMKAVLQNNLVNADASDADLKRMTEQAMTASQVVGEEVDRIARAAHQMLVTGLADSATEAIDMIVKASQDGLNVTGDLIDTLEEYGTKFRDLGITGQESLGLIKQAMDGGARNTDVAADALKEFVIRAQDGSATTIRGFTSIGLNAKDMGNAIAAGGTTAHEALRKTLNALQAIPDPAMRSQAAVDLFGTKAEDLGAALYKMDLDSASQQFKDFAGSTQQAADSISKATPPFEIAGRNIKNAFNDVADAMFGAPDIPEDMQRHMDALKKKQQDATKQKDEFNQRVDQAAHAWEHEAGSIQHNTRTLAENIDKHKEAMGIFMSAEESAIRYEDALDKGAQSLKENGKTLDINTEKGRNNKQALLDLADAAYKHVDAMEKQGATAPEVTDAMATARDQFIDLAKRMGLSADQAGALADKLNLIPGDYVANVKAETTQANSALSYTQQLLGLLHDKTITLNVAERRTILQDARFGNIGFAHGGIVGGGGVPVLSRQTGGPGHAAIVQDEMGPEIAVHPDGTMIIPAGLSRHLLAGGGVGQDRSSSTRAGDIIVRVYIGDQELRGIVRTEISESNRGIRRSVTAGAGAAR